MQKVLHQKVLHIVLLAIILISSGQNDHQQFRIKETKAYIVQYPANWELKYERATEKAELFKLTSHKYADVDFNYMLLPNSVDISNYIGHTKSELLNSKKLIDFKVYNKNGRQYNRFNYKVNGYEGAECLQIICLDGHKAYSLSFSYFKPTEDVYKKQGIKILESFEVK